MGDKTAKALDKGLQLRTCGDLLRHYPRRYVERGVLTPLSELRIDEDVTVMAEIAKVDLINMRNRKGQMVKVVVTDGVGKLTVTFFNQGWRAKQLRVGQRGLFAGRVGEFRGQRQLTHPLTQLLEGDDVEAVAPALLAPFTAVYPATQQLPTWNIAKAVRIVLDQLDPVADPLPDDVRDRHGLIGFFLGLHPAPPPPTRGGHGRARSHRLVRGPPPRPPAADARGLRAGARATEVGRGVRPADRPRATTRGR